MFYTIAKSWRRRGNSFSDIAKVFANFSNNSAIVEVPRYVVFPHEQLTGPDGTNKPSENKPLHDS